MKVLSKSSRGVFEPSPSPPLVLHDRISRQIHVTRMRHEFLKQRAGDILGTRTKSMERLGVLRFEQFFPRLRGRKRVDGLTFRGSGGGAFPPPKGLRPSGATTTTASFERYAPPVDQSSAALSNPRPSDTSIGRIQTRRRSKATRPGHPCARARELRAINHAYTPRAPTKSSPR